MGARLAARPDTSLKRLGPLLAIALVALLAWMMAAAATAKPFWHDEIYTILLAGQPTLRDTADALRDGTDLQPPLNTLLTRAVRQTVGLGPVATRLPAITGFLLMVGALGWMLRVRTGTTLALAGMLIPVQTAAYRYGYEARGYGLLLGCFALAFCAWAEAARGERRRIWLPVLALALAGGVWAHYHAVFGMLALAAGELTRWFERRRVDAGVLAALAAGALLCAPLVPLAMTASAQAPHFWARTAAEGLGDTYHFLLGSFLQLLSTPLGITTILLALLALVRRRWQADVRSARAASFAPELVVAGAALALPALMHLLSQVANVPFTPRYGLASIVGLAVGVPLGLRALAGGTWLPAAALLMLVALPVAVSAASTSGWRAPADPVADRIVLQKALAGPGPLIAAGSLTYLQLWYYSPPALRPRLVCVADPDAALRITGTDTIDRGYLALARHTALPIRTYQEVVAGRRELTVYAAGSGWLLTKLEEDGALIEEAGREPGGRLLRVTWPAR